jgi:hypothetical protein
MGELYVDTEGDTHVLMGAKGGVRTTATPFSRWTQAKVQKLSFKANCRFLGGKVPPAWPNVGLFIWLFPIWKLV